MLYKLGEEKESGEQEEWAKDFMMESDEWQFYNNILGWWNHLWR